MEWGDAPNYHPGDVQHSDCMMGGLRTFERQCKRSYVCKATERPAWGSAISGGEQRIWRPGLKTAGDRSDGASLSRCGPVDCPRYMTLAPSQIGHRPDQTGEVEGASRPLDSTLGSWSPSSQEPPSTGLGGSYEPAG